MSISRDLVALYLSLLKYQGKIRPNAEQVQPKGTYLYNIVYDKATCDCDGPHLISFPAKLLKERE